MPGEGHLVLEVQVQSLSCVRLEDTLSLSELIHIYIYIYMYAAALYACQVISKGMPTCLCLSEFAPFHTSVNPGPDCLQSYFGALRPLTLSLMWV